MIATVAGVLTERDEAIASREVVLGRIKQLTADNPGQQERWQDLRQQRVDFTDRRSSFVRVSR